MAWQSFSYPERRVSRTNASLRGLTTRFGHEQGSSLEEWSLPRDCRCPYPVPLSAALTSYSPILRTEFCPLYHRVVAPSDCGAKTRMSESSIAWCIARGSVAPAESRTPLRNGSVGDVTSLTWVRKQRFAPAGTDPRVASVGRLSISRAPLHRRQGAGRDRPSIRVCRRDVSRQTACFPLGAASAPQRYRLGCRPVSEAHRGSRCSTSVLPRPIGLKVPMSNSWRPFHLPVPAGVRPTAARRCPRPRRRGARR